MEGIFLQAGEDWLSEKVIGELALYAIVIGLPLFFLLRGLARRFKERKRR